MNVSEEISKIMMPVTYHKFNVFGYDFVITDTIITMWVIMAFLIISAFILTRKMKVVPEGKQNFAEVIVDFVNDFVKDTIGHHWKNYAPYLGSILLFLLFSNTLSIFDIIPNWEKLHELTGWGWLEYMPHYNLRPPTKDINVTASMAITSILMVLYSSIRYKKVSGWLKSFVNPTPVIAPFAVLEYGIKPLALCLRLFGNIFAAFIIMELIKMVVPVIVPAAFSLYFDLFDGILQAYIFVFLTSLYVGEGIE